MNFGINITSFPELLGLDGKDVQPTCEYIVDFTF